MSVAPAELRAPADLLRCYLANLAALYEADGALAARVEAVPFAALPALEAARDGELTVHLRADDGQPVYAHSRYAPLAEARKLVEPPRQPRKAGEHAAGSADAAAPEPPTDDLDAACFFVAGFGLGYVTVEVERRFVRPLILVAEADLAVLKAGLCVTDVSQPLRERRLMFLTAADKAELH
ncbi:MAG: hypothetical protein AB1716_10350, partial [Planctomycetota bacterium]